MHRRSFITVVGAVASAAILLPRSARAQAAKTPVLGVLALGNPPPEAFLKSLRAGLQHFGYHEGRNIQLSVRAADGSSERLAQQAAELVAARVDVIVAYQTPASVVAMQATREIPLPVVFAATGDPVGSGLVASYARPGGNLTGTTAGAVEVAGKMVELVRELFPSARRFAALANEGDVFTKSYLGAIAQVSGVVNLELDAVMVRPKDPLRPAFERISAKGAEAVLIQGSLVSQEAVDLANTHRLPSLGSSQALARLGGLMCYSADFDAMMRDTAGYIDKILKGAKPADLPVTFPSAFEMILNLKTAKALGLTIPEAFMQRANEVIE